LAERGSGAEASRRSIFVTGAASGIGLATSRLFAKRGWFVGLFDVDEPRLREIAAEIGEASSTSGRLDVTSADDCRRAVELFAGRSGGRMDVLFNCAGIMRMGLFDEVPLDVHVRTAEVNFVGVIQSTYAALELLKRTPGARVVSMCSASAFYGVPEVATYSASKFAVRGLTEALNIELERHGIWVTDLMPPYVNTPMIRGQAVQAGTVKTLGIALAPEDVAELVWRAATGRRKVHWVPTLQLKIMAASSRLLPFLQRVSMRFLARLPAPRAGTLR
jgi:NAD(P)-dependent dehydrogenase (short-subunit alcohol dehydrogenase family)